MRNKGFRAAQIKRLAADLGLVPQFQPACAKRSSHLFRRSARIGLAGSCAGVTSLGDRGHRSRPMALRK